ncbi:MAG: IS91 family transposase [Planctomycetaceae bacterium]
MSTAVSSTAEQPRQRKPELADIVRGSAILVTDRLSPTQRKAFGAITACRTAKLGGQRFSCDDCGYERYVYHSCRHRACPKCQTQARQKWVNDRKAELLPVPYFHLVFTLPHSLNPLIGWNEKNQRALLSLLFHAASRTLLEFGETRFGGKIGITMVLHTWTQQLQSHYHVHCVVPAGALSPDGRKWCVAGRNFLFPVHALSKVFRAKYAEGLAALLKADDKVDVPPHLSTEFSSATSIDRWIHRNLMSTPWVVYSQRPFGGPERVLEYLSLYTHRTAIGNERILSYDGTDVCFRWKDRVNDDAVRTSRIPAADFLIRFASHVLPNRFMRIRHFGLLANRAKTERLNLCRTLMGHRPRERNTEKQTALQWLEEVCGLNESICPCCQLPLRVSTIPKSSRLVARLLPASLKKFNDSS